MPVAAAQAPLPTVTGLRAEPGNHVVDLAWTASADPRVVGYTVYAFRDGELLSSTNVTATNHRASGLVNERSYAFQVAARDAGGVLGPASAPVGATPANPRDLVYLAAGLIVTWLSLFGYAAVLARREYQLDQKLERLLEARNRGNQP